MNILGVAPVFQVRDLNDSLKYYKDVLGFIEDFRFGEYAGIRLGEVSLHLCGHDFHKRPVGGGAAAIFCDEVDRYFAEIKSKGGIVKVEPSDRPYGMRDFVVLDPDGNHLNFGCASREAAMAAHA
jgi:catechol 2,3-dioxygenase-like lactoylglutathione lyase family enzyme